MPRRRARKGNRRRRKGGSILTAPFRLPARAAWGAAKETAKLGWGITRGTTKAALGTGKLGYKVAKASVVMPSKLATGTARVGWRALRFGGRTTGRLAKSGAKSGRGRPTLLGSLLSWGATPGLSSRPYSWYASDIDAMDGHDFEHFVADLLPYQGFTNVQVTQASNDWGVDIIAWRSGLKYAIQTKRYSHKVDYRALAEVLWGRTHYGCGPAMVVTNNFFTPRAQHYSVVYSCELVDGATLSRWIADRDRATLRNASQQGAGERPGRDWAGIWASLMFGGESAATWLAPSVNRWLVPALKLFLLFAAAFFVCGGLAGLVQGDGLNGGLALLVGMALGWWYLRIHGRSKTKAAALEHVQTQQDGQAFRNNAEQADMNAPRISFAGAGADDLVASQPVTPGTTEQVSTPVEDTAACSPPMLSEYLDGSDATVVEDAYQPDNLDTDTGLIEHALAELSHLAEMREQGEISEFEFRRRKAEILGEPEPEDDEGGAALSEAAQDEPSMPPEMLRMSADANAAFLPSLYWPGERVRHAQFGEGRVISVVPRGSDHIVTVEFEGGVGTKKLSANMENLERV